MVKVDDDKVKEIVSLYENGETVKSLSLKFKLTSAVVNRVLKNKNVTMRGRGRRKANAGVPAVSVAQGVMEATISAPLTKHTLEEIREKMLKEAEKFGINATD